MTDFTPREFNFLPSHAQAKLLHLHGQQQGAEEVRRGAQALEQRAFDVVREHEHLVRQQQLRMMTTVQGGPSTEGMTDSLKREEARLEQAQREWRARKDQVDRAAAQAGQWEVVSRVREWLSGAAQDGTTRFRDRRYQGRHPGASLREAVSGYRSRLVEIEASYQSVAHAPATAAELLEVVQAQLDEIAQQGSRKIDRTNRTDPLGLNPGYNAFSGSFGTFITPAQGMPNHAAAFLVWLLRDEIAKHLPAIIGKDAPGALSYDQREKSIGKLAMQRLDLERQEEAAIVAAEAEGTFIPRRPDADPRAVLEIEEG